MKRINFNIKDRKMLFTLLCLTLVCVFTLTIAYSALDAVLKISGNAKVTAANWNIYLNNPKVTNGSATTDVPTIQTKNTLNFNTILNMPGDFYEFTVDIVNGGEIDAMIANIIKTPELTEEEAKYLKYEITYQNGESITNKQTLNKYTTMPIKIRIEYRKDINASDLPTEQITLDLSLTLEYIQSDGTGSIVKNDGTEVIYVNTPDELIETFNNMQNNTVISLQSNLDMTGKTLTPVSDISFTLYGNGYKISNLNTTDSALFVDQGNVGRSYTFKNLNLENCSVNSTDNYAGLFIGAGVSNKNIIIDGCNINNCSVSGAKYAALFLGYGAGYGEDVQHIITNNQINGCSVTGGGSTGGIVGHAGGSNLTTTIINNITIDNTIVTGEDAEHEGLIVGTAHIGITKISNITTYKYTLTHNGNNPAHFMYGRFVPDTTGKLIIDDVEIK